MTKPASTKPEQTTQDALRNGIRWDALSAIIASFIGLLALVVAGYTAYIQREQVRAQVWTNIQLGQSDMLPTDVLGGKTHGGQLVAINRGVGPAIVRSVVVRVDGNPQPTWDSVFAALGDPKPPYASISSLNHTTLSPGEQLDFLTILGAKDWAHFKSEIGSRVSIRTCYCSALGECWTSTLGVHTKRHWAQPVKACPAIQATDQFRD